MEPRSKEDYPFPLERRQIKGDVDLSYGFQAVPDDSRVTDPELFQSRGIEISFGLVRCFLEIADKDDIFLGNPMTFARQSAEDAADLTHARIPILAFPRPNPAATMRGFGKRY